MYYSLTFGNEVNTWADWNLIPETPPMIPAPEPNLNLVEIPGRAQGALDISELLFGRMTYKRMTGSWSFVCEPRLSTTRMDICDRIRGYLHGKSTTVTLEDDPFHFYKGRFTVALPQNASGLIKIGIGFDLEPRRFNLDGTVDDSYLPS